MIAASPFAESDSLFLPNNMRHPPSSASLTDTAINARWMPCASQPTWTSPRRNPGAGSILSICVWDGLRLRILQHQVPRHEQQRQDPDDLDRDRPPQEPPRILVVRPLQYRRHELEPVP